MISIQQTLWNLRIKQAASYFAFTEVGKVGQNLQAVGRGLSTPEELYAWAIAMARVVADKANESVEGHSFRPLSSEVESEIELLRSHGIFVLLEEVTL